MLSFGLQLSQAVQAVSNELLEHLCWAWDFLQLQRSKPELGHKERMRIISAVQETSLRLCSSKPEYIFNKHKKYLTVLQLKGR